MQSERPSNAKLTDLREDFGGCAGNIAYNLSLLGQQPCLFSVLGDRDAAAYADHLQERGIDRRHVLTMPDASTARGIIITQAAGDQFTAFYPGPLPGPDTWTAHLAKADWRDTAIFVQAPYPQELMQAALQYVGTLADAPLRVCCPGQYTEMVGAEGLRSLAALSDVLVGNAAERRIIEAALAQGPHPILVATHGGKDVTVITSEGSTVYPVARAAVVDPTGCGDAFLAGLVAGSVSRPFANADAVAQGIRLARRCLAEWGAQRHAAA